MRFIGDPKDRQFDETRILSVITSPQGLPAIAIDRHLEMFLANVCGKIFHAFPRSNRRGIELFFADRAAGDANVGIGNWFEENLGATRA